MKKEEEEGTSRAVVFLSEPYKVTYKDLKPNNQCPKAKKAIFQMCLFYPSGIFAAGAERGWQIYVCCSRAVVKRTVLPLACLAIGLADKYWLLLTGLCARRHTRILRKYSNAISAPVRRRRDSRRWSTSTGKVESNGEAYHRKHPCPERKGYGHRASRPRENRKAVTMKPENEKLIIQPVPPAKSFYHVGER